MKWTPWILGSLTAFAISACGGERQNNGTSDTGTESGTMQGGAATDTAVRATGTTADTAQGGARMGADTAATSGTHDTLHSGGDTAGAAH